MAERCTEQVEMRGLNFYRTKQCSRNAVKDGKCGLHTDEAKARREQRKVDTFHANRPLRMARYLAQLKGKKNG